MSVAMLDVALSQSPTMLFIAPALTVLIASSSERAVVACMATMFFVGTAANFLIPLYIQVVQGRTSIEASFAIIPYTLSIFLTSTFVAYLYGRFSPRILAAAGFVVVATALTILAFTVRGEWGQAFVVIGLVLLGLGQGSIVALVFNTLLSAAPQGAQRGQPRRRELPHQRPAPRGARTHACTYPLTSRSLWSWRGRAGRCERARVR